MEQWRILSVVLFLENEDILQEMNPFSGYNIKMSGGVRFEKRSTDSML